MGNYAASGGYYIACNAIFEVTQLQDQLVLEYYQILHR
jgi:hypothetical protein